MKRKMEEVVREQKDFLLTLETTSELHIWSIFHFGVPKVNTYLYLDEQLRKNGIFRERLINSWANGMSLDKHFAAMKSYEEKVKKWNSEQE
jgi:hypothetical protein